MNPRLIRWLLLAAPPRDRYGPEIAILTCELIGNGDTTPGRAAMDLLGTSTATM
jgi:hypothetical protein